MLKQSIYAETVLQDSSGRHSSGRHGVPVTPNKTPVER